MRATRGRTPTLRSPRSPRASRSGAGRRQRWWARTGGLIAGHARVLAARQLGIGEIPVMVAAGWTEAQKRAYVLADNQLAITGSGWDPELLRLAPDPHGCPGRRDRREHQGMGLDVASAGGRGWRPDCGPRQVLAARQLGIVKIPVMVAAGWTEAQKRAYVLADNQLAITGSGWDPELLRL